MRGETLGRTQRNTVWQKQPGRPRFTLLLLVLCCASYVQSSPTQAANAPTAICDQVAQLAADKTGVPLFVLQAITRTETGRKRNGRFGPWPWTVNMEGKGVWFETLDEARAYVFKNFKRGARSFDVGCFQINYKWHHQHFSSIDEMFDPVANALYAARFLKSLHEETGDWTEAAGAYHSRTPKYANRYKKIFEKHRKRAPGRVSQVAVQVASAPDERLSPQAPPRLNRYPLLKSGSSGRLGSLMPFEIDSTPTRFLKFRATEG